MKASTYNRVGVTQVLPAEKDPTKKELRHKLKRERERVRRIEKALTKQESEKQEQNQTI
jgi:hypothetical protein